MAGRGPAPKPKAQRRRPGSAVRGATTLQAVTAENREELERNIPALPSGFEWMPHVVEWWRAVFTSPMAAEYTAVDVHGLRRLAVLENAFWADPSEKTAAEIRLQQQSFGLTPLDRQRLRWEIERGEAAGDRTQSRRAAPKATARRDPRLKVV